jgi:gas vesicle protein
MNAVADNVRARLAQVRAAIDEVVNDLEIAGDDLKDRVAAKLKDVHSELGEVIEELEAATEEEDDEPAE